jgi:hypothetical protein
LLAAVKAELEMRAQQLNSSQPNLTEQKKNAPAEANSNSSRLYSTLIDERVKICLGASLLLLLKNLKHLSMNLLVH